MKKIYLISALAVVAAASLTSCDDFLEENRYPETSIINNKDYWNNATNCQYQVDRFIDEINPGYGEGGGQGWFLYKTLSDDQVGSSFADWDFLAVPSTNGNWTYTQVRGANTIIEGVNGATQLSSSEKRNFLGIARFIRAVAYYKLVRTFGDVVWTNKVLDVNSEELYAGRTDRDVVMDSVFADLDYALANISKENDKLSWSKDLIRAYKCEVALYEGTYCKYRTEAENYKGANMDRANKYLNESVAMAEALMNSGRYTFGENIEDYHALYNSVWGGGESTVKPGEKISDFNKLGEIIFGRHYDKNNGRHSVISYTASSTTTSGMSLDGFLAFLNIDGTPVPQATREDIIANTIGENTFISDTIPAYSIAKQIEKRDKRLGVITDPNIYYKGMEWNREGCAGMNSSSGFGIAKYDNVLLPVSDRTNSAQNYTSCPIYWLSYIYCNYAEAKAELGTLTDADLNASINKLYKRAGLPEQTVAGLSAINDPANNMGVSSLLWEIRRCRRCELMFDNWIRYWDLNRWHQLELLDSQKHPNVLRGAYIDNANKKPGNSVDGFVRPYPDMERVFTSKQYLQPIPSSQFDLYKEHGNALVQNPLWK